MDIKDWLQDSIIFECISGSQAYGLSTPESDTDYRGVCIPPKDYFIGTLKFNQHETKDPDRTIFNIAKFIQLASVANPNVIEYLYVPEECILKTSPSWQMLLDHRDIFLSKKCKYTYTGYAHSQLKRVRTHRNWLMSPPKEVPTRVSFGLPEQEKLPKELMGAIDATIKMVIKNEIETYIRETDYIDTDIIKEAIRDELPFTLEEALIEFAPPPIQKMLENSDIFMNIGSKFFPEEVMSIYERERNFKNALTHWNQYQTWLKNRNPKRSALETKFGFDTKHVMHTFRLLFQGRDILTKGVLHVKLLPEDRDFCRAVRAGVYGYDELMEKAEKLIEEFNTLYNRSCLKKEAIVNGINLLQQDIITKFLRL